MSIIKLPNVGDEATFTVSGCESATGNFGEQIKFTGANGELLYLGKDSALRQLGRALDWSADNEPDLGSVVGLTLRFYRTANTKTKGAAPFWNINVVHASEAKPKAASKRLAGPPPSDPSDPGPLPPDAAIAGTDGQLLGSPTIDRIIIEKRELIESAYRFAYDASHRVQMDVCEGLGAIITPTADSIQAGAATILIQMEKRGAI